MIHNKNFQTFPQRTTKRPRKVRKSLQKRITEKRTQSESRTQQLNNQIFAN